MGCPGWVAPAQIYSAANPAGIHIYASMQFIPALQAEQQVAATVIKRTAEQLGNLLQDGPDGSLYSMIEYVPTQPLFYVPTDWLTPLAATTLIIDGVAFMALPLPCETDSNIALYVPSLRVAFVSSIYYRQQPFIGTVRGGTPRFVCFFCKTHKFCKGRSRSGSSRYPPSRACTPSPSESATRSP